MASKRIALVFAVMMVASTAVADNHELKCPIGYICIEAEEGGYFAALVSYCEEPRLPYAWGPHSFECVEQAEFRKLVNNLIARIWPNE